MPKLEDLIAIAYKKERTVGRRLARDSALSERDALKQTLEKIAGHQTLFELIAARKCKQQDVHAAVQARRLAKADRLAERKADMQPPAEAWLAWFDGATHPNPGKMGLGGVLKSPDGQVLEISLDAGHGDSNEAEYLALIAVLEAAVPVQPEQLVVYGDSRVVIDDMNRIGGAGAHRLRIHCHRATQLVAQLSSVTLTWLPRTKNTAADALSQQAIARVNDRN